MKDGDYVVWGNDLSLALRRAMGDGTQVFFGVYAHGERGSVAYYDNDVGRILICIGPMGWSVLPAEHWSLVPEQVVAARGERAST